MCDCKNRMCPKCDPGIEAFYQQKIKEAGPFADCVDAKDVWREYCALREVEAIDDEVDSTMEKDYGPGYIESFLQKIDKNTGY